MNLVDYILADDLGETVVQTASLSQSFPFFHRSCRNHSEYAEDMGLKLSAEYKTSGMIVGRGFEAVENCVRAGIFYEKGMLDKAYYHAVRAVSEVYGEIPPETEFCAYMMLASALYARNSRGAADEIVAGIHRVIIEKGCNYLLPNLEAFVVRRRICEGDVDAAYGWLQDGTGGTVDDALVLCKIYQYFTSARAYIATGANDAAITFVQRLIILCESYNRPLDTMDALILLSIALRRKRRAKNADEALAKAVEIAQKYGFVQSFLSESAELASELGRLFHRVMQPQFKGLLDVAFVKYLYLAAARQSRHEVSATGFDELNLSERQLELIRLLVDGRSYKEISDETNLKISTIKTYLRAAYKKLGAVNRREAAAKAEALGIINIKSGGGDANICTEKEKHR